ncbi:MAG: helix-turn-helix domain containing protein [Lachnospiraceae bacterium]|nr:helix-turn-helix domain containing protein [Lachnospiraceae bacterium]
MKKPDDLERAIYTQICRSNGIRAREIAAVIGADRTTVNRYLYASPYISDLCYRDESFRWHGSIRQTVPHRGLSDYAGWYGSAAAFLAQDEETFLRELERGCAFIGRNLNDTRGLFHSFRDTRETVRGMLADLAPLTDTSAWELVFELRIRRSRTIRIYADVLVIACGRVFSLEFKMKDRIDPGEVSQAAKYAPFLEVIFGPGWDVIPALVLTRAHDVFTYAPLGGSGGEIPVLSGDLLFDLPAEYLGLFSE